VAIECTGRVQINAPPSRCFAVAADIEGYPDWADEVEKVTVLERGDEGQALRVAMEVYLFRKDFSTTLDFDHGQAPDELSFTLVESRKLRTLTGSYAFVPSGDGSTMAFRLRAEFIKPKAPRIERFAGRKIETAITRDLRRHIERQSRRVAR
jgi:ribosome-associated toxin RatA of RatAB toxin-antitoxin module